MKKVLLRGVAISALMFFAFAASAAGNKTYVGFIAGQTKVDISSSGADAINDTDTSFKLFAGTDINPNLAFEFGYIDFGNYGAHYPLYNETDSFEGNALFVTAIGKAMVANNLSLYAKIGFDYWRGKADANATVSGIPVSGSGDGTGLSPVFGFGLNFDVTDRLALRAEWERYSDVGDGVNVTFSGLGSVKLTGSDVDVLGVGLQYQF